MVEDTVNPVDTPGQLLRDARLRSGLSVEEVAEQLRLASSVIYAIEDDDFYEMPGRTYVLGYLRNYARLVNAQIENAISEHDELLPRGLHELPSEAVDTPEQVSVFANIPTGWVIGSVLAVAVAGYIGFVYFKRSHEAERVQLATPAPSTLSQDAERKPEIVSPSPPPRPEQPPPLSEPQIATTAPIKTQVEIPQETKERPLRPFEFDTRMEPVVSAAVPSTPRAEEGSRSVDNSSRKLVLYFDEGSWVSVRDRTETRLLNNTITAGETVELEGEPPFTVFLGNAPGVRVQYEGTFQKLVTPERGLFARFTVGSKAP